MRIRHHLIRSASLVALTVLATPALAQTSAADPQGTTQDVEPAQEDEVVVTGIRESLRASIAAKRNSGVISEVITAEDIGKFPDKNVAEALQRVPGIVINREFAKASASRSAAPRPTSLRRSSTAMRSPPPTGSCWISSPPPARSTT